MTTARKKLHASLTEQDYLAQMQGLPYKACFTCCGEAMLVDDKSILKRLNGPNK